MISAGPPATVGTFIVKDLRLTTAVPQQPQTLIQNPDSDLPPETLERHLPEWNRAGLISSMASHLHLSWLNPPVSAFQIRDHSSSGHCEWVSPKVDIQFLNPGTELSLTWEEMYDIGLSEPLSLTYSDLAPRLYHLDLQTTDAFVSPTPASQTVAFTIPPPFWTSLWFSAFITSSSFAAFFGVRNRIIRNRLQRELAAANEARLIETERMRINCLKRFGTLNPEDRLSSAHIARKVVQYFSGSAPSGGNEEALSPRETEVIELLASGYISKEIADQLNIGVETVRTHIKRICIKMQVRNSMEAVAKHRA
ncbi:MAG: LuxR C-terminal-related transcriptional regulator [Verrucomicrobiota bacterium]